MKRKKIEIKPALKASDYTEGVIFETAFIKSVDDIPTEYGDSTIILFEHNDIVDTLFMNVATNNALIDGYGEDDRLWVNKPVSLNCEINEKYKKKMLVLRPIKS